MQWFKISVTPPFQSLFFNIKRLRTDVNSISEAKQLWYLLLNCNLSGGCFYPLPCWFFLNNLEAVEAVNLMFCSIQQLFIRDILAKFGTPNFSSFSNIEQNSEECNSNFRISGRSVSTNIVITRELVMILIRNLTESLKFKKSNTVTPKTMTSSIFFEPMADLE